MATYNDQTITFTYAELKVLRNAIIGYETQRDRNYDELYDKVERALHTALGEAIREARNVCNDCDYQETSMCPFRQGKTECQLRDDMEKAEEEEQNV